MPISLPNTMSNHFLESSHRDDSNKWSNIGFGEEISQVELVEVIFTHLIWCSDKPKTVQDIGSLLISVFNGSKRVLIVS